MSGSGQVGRLLAHQMKRTVLCSSRGSRNGAAAAASRSIGSRSYYQHHHRHAGSVATSDRGLFRFGPVASIDGTFPKQFRSFGSRAGSPASQSSKANAKTDKGAPEVHETPKFMDFTTLVDLHLITRQSFADRPLFGRKLDPEGEFEWMSYKDFGKDVDVCRAALASQGIKRGDKVAIISNNRVEWAILAYATYSLGAAFVPMYEQMLQKDWQYIVSDSGAKALFVASEDIYHQTFHFAGVQGKLESVWCLDASPTAPHSFKQLMSTTVAEQDPVPPFLPHPDDIATLIYTSGTTGKPKGVMLSHANIISNVTGLRSVIPPDSISCHDRSLSFLPWAHCYGQTLELHVLHGHGAAMGIAESIEKLPDNLQEVRPTALYSVPTLFKKIYDGIHAKMAASSPLVQFLFKRSVQASHHRRLLLESDKSVGLMLHYEHLLLDKLVLSKIRDRLGGQMRVCFVGGAATPLPVLQFFENIGIQICEGYGLTETSPLISVNSPGLKNRKLGTTGRMLEGQTVMVWDNAAEMPCQQEEAEGEVCVSGPNVMLGYHNLPEATAEVFFEYKGRRFFKTGDLGMLVEGKYLKITGRIKEMYKLENGKYVVPGPIEADLAASTFITQALLYGENRPYNVALLVPDWDAIRAWAVEKTDLGPDATKQELSAHPIVHNLIEGEVQLRLEKVKRYEQPKSWTLLEEGFTAERGMMTPKMSVKRHVVIKEHMSDLLHLYGETGVTDADREEELQEAVSA